MVNTNNETVQDPSLIRFLYCDNAGLIRGKSIPAAARATRLRSGIGCTVAMAAVTVTDDLVPIPGMGVVGEFRLMADPTTFVSVPSLHLTAVMCDMLGLDRLPWGACPRSFLKRMDARLQQRGLRAHVGTEHEFHLLRPESGRLLAADASSLFGTDVLDLHAPFLTDVLWALDAAKIVPSVVHAEYGPGQMELAVTPVEALTAADHICLFRQIVRAAASHADMRVSFAPKPFCEQMAGNGQHLHLSIWHRDSNLFYDDQAEGAFSLMGRWFLGGVLAHLPALVALTCGSVNSYQRLGPHTWSSAYGCWGFDNREAALRVPSLYWGQEQASANVELRCADHSGNPYLALGGILAAGYDGMEQRLDPGEPLACDPSSLSEEERSRRGIRRLPETLASALDALEADSFLMQALGPDLATSYLAVKRAEVACFQESDPEAIASAHLLKY